MKSGKWEESEIIFRVHRAPGLRRVLRVPVFCACFPPWAFGALAIPLTHRLTRGSFEIYKLSTSCHTVAVPAGASAGAPLCAGPYARAVFRRLEDVRSCVLAEVSVVLELVREIL